MMYIESRHKARLTTARADKKQKGRHLFKPGQSGNPAGREKGSHNGHHALMKALEKDFEEHGDGVIALLRTEHPVEYAKLYEKAAARYLPRDHMHSHDLGPIAVQAIEDMRQYIRDFRLVEAAKLAIGVDAVVIEAVPDEGN
jgi:hypothetical protein